MATKYSTNERKTIIDAYDKVLDDVNRLWEKSEQDKIEVWTYLEKRSEPKGIMHRTVAKTGYVIITDNEIYLEFRNFAPIKKVTLERKNKFGKRIRNYDLATIEQFLENYQETRVRIKNEIEKGIEDKKRKIDIFRSLDEEYSKTADIELSLPETINPHAITLRQEDGKSIGEIRIGANLIRIITNGLITVEQENKNEKVKSIGGK